jgi:hypothetical protein
MSSEFGLLCEELAAFQAARPLVRPDEARHRAALAKALDNPGAAVAHMAATRHQRTAAATKAQRQLDASLNRTLADLGVMAKAMSVPSPREAFTACAAERNRKPA